MKYQIVVKGTVVEAIRGLTSAVPGAEVVESSYRLAFNETLLVIKTEASAAKALNEWMVRGLRAIGAALGTPSWWRGLDN